MLIELSFFQFLKRRRRDLFLAEFNQTSNEIEL